MKPLAIALITLSLLARPAAAAPPAPIDDLARLQALVRCESVNPPGNELDAARLVAGWLTQAGLPSQLYESVPGRASVVARLSAGPHPSGEGPLLLLGHLDVVPVEATHWHHPPFAAEVADGRLYGRGTLDMKQIVAWELRAFLALAQHPAALRRDVILCAVADEEAGGKGGAGWLIAHHPDEVRCSEVLNEGGSGLVAPNSRAVMGIQVAERGSLWVRVTAVGKPGHGAQERPDSAPRRLLHALARLEGQPRQFELGPETGPMLAALGASTGGFKGLVLQGLANPLLMPFLAPTVVAREPLVAPLLGMTVNPDVLTAGQKVNVVPAEASAEIDLRMLPGHTVATTLAWLKRALGDPSLAITILSSAEPSRNDTAGALYRALADAARARYPGILVTPILTPGGGTDSSYFRLAGARCYGCAPMLASAEQLTSIHGDDEYITLEQLSAGGQVMEAAVRQAATVQAR